MKPLTKDEVRKLTPEQQHALGDMEVQRVRGRDQLLMRARGSMTIGATLLTTFACCVAMFSIPYPRLVPFAIIVAVGVVTFHVSRVHLRVDAVVELLNHNKGSGCD